MEQTLRVSPTKFDPASVVAAIVGALALIWASFVTARQSKAVKLIDAQTAWQTNLVTEVTQLRTSIIALEGALDTERKMRRELEDAFADEKRLTDSLRKQMGELAAERDGFRQKYEALIRTIKAEVALPTGWSEDK